MRSVYDADSGIYPCNSTMGKERISNVVVKYGGCIGVSIGIHGDAGFMHMRQIERNVIGTYGPFKRTSPNVVTNIFNNTEEVDHLIDILQRLKNIMERRRLFSNMYSVDGE